MKKLKNKEKFVLTTKLLIDSKGRIKDTILHEDAFEIIKRKITNNLKGIE